MNRPRIGVEEVRRRTLARQFPRRAPGAGGPPDAAEILALLEHLGPIQSQVPRSPFLTVSSRLPGARHADVCAVFEQAALLKGSNIRGTVHTAVARQFVGLQAVAADRHRHQLAATLRIDPAQAEALVAEIEQFCGPTWRPRADIVQHARTWLARCCPDAQHDELGQTLGAGLTWGHGGLCRRPKDGHWEKRTDAFHRSVRAVRPDLVTPAPADALAAAVRTGIGALGPVTRRDLAYFFAVRLGEIDTALAALGDDLIALTGPQDEVYLDLTELDDLDRSAGTAEDGPEGVRLLAEFDALLTGVHGSHRDRFVDASQLPSIWARVNGIFSPTVLQDGRLVATWRTTRPARRTAIEITLLEGAPALSADACADAVRATQQALDLDVTDLVIRSRP